MTNKSKNQAELSLGVSPQEVDQATKNHRLKTEVLVANDVPDKVIQSTLNTTEVTYRKLADSNTIDLDDYKFYYACLVANAVVYEQGSGKFEYAKRLINQGLRRLVDEHDLSICAAHGVLSMAFHAINPSDTHNIAQHLIQATKEKECPPLLHKRLADMGYTTPSPAGLDEHGTPYYRWKGKDGIASCLWVRRSPKKP